MAEQPTYPSLQRRLVGIYEFNVRFTVKTGLLVRKPSKAQLSIGGADVWPMTIERLYVCDGTRIGPLEVPYIPGSSIKGRMRSLLELSLGLRLVTTDGKIYMHVRSISAFQKSTSNPTSEFYNDVVGRCVIDEVFGYASFQYQQLFRELGVDEVQAQEIMNVVAPTRLHVEDFYPSSDYVCSLYRRLQRQLYLSDFLEEKSENRIDRLTSAADPREMVRVKPGVEFDGRIMLLVFDNDITNCPQTNVQCVKRNIELVARGLKLLETLGLGAATSRGYGRVLVSITGVRFIEPMGTAKPLITKAVSIDDLLSKELDSLVSAVVGIKQ